YNNGIYESNIVDELQEVHIELRDIHEGQDKKRRGTRARRREDAGTATCSYIQPYIITTRGPRQNSASRRRSEEFNDAETEKVIPKRINKLESPDD
ncbi:hypothetical protein L0F63_007513, partial [Massospora cicadina]